MQAHSAWDFGISSHQKKLLCVKAEEYLAFACFGNGHTDCSCASTRTCLLVFRTIASFSIENFDNSLEKKASGHLTPVNFEK